MGGHIASDKGRIGRRKKVEWGHLDLFSWSWRHLASHPSGFLRSAECDLWPFIDHLWETDCALICSLHAVTFEWLFCHGCGVTSAQSLTSPTYKWQWSNENHIQPLPGWTSHWVVASLIAVAWGVSVHSRFLRDWGGEWVVMLWRHPIQQLNKPKALTANIFVVLWLSHFYWGEKH